MSFIDKVLININSMTADDIIQAMADIYSEPIEREEIVVKYPQFIQDIIFIIDFDTELAMQGIGGLLENRAGRYISNIIIALRNIQADNEAILLQEIYEKYKANPEDESIDESADKLYLYTGFDIWELLEIYVDKEKCRE